MGRKMEVQETVNKDFNFAKQFLPLPVKVAPMARAQWCLLPVFAAQQQ